jgi:hypothetical protein
MNNKKPKPTIEPIVIPEDKLNKLNLILNSNYSSFLKQRMIRQIAGGYVIRVAKYLLRF